MTFRSEDHGFVRQHPDALNVVRVVRDEFCLSYNPFDFAREFSALRMFPETAICVPHETEDTKFYILKGDHREVYASILDSTDPEQQLSACLAYFRSQGDLIGGTSDEAP